MTAYVPSRVAARVTRQDKIKVWRAIQPPARLFFTGIAEATGVPLSIVMEIWAEGSAAGRMRIGDDTPGFRFIEPVGGGA